MDTGNIFNLNQIQRSKYSFLGENEKLLIKPYFDERDTQSLSILLDPAFKKDIEQQIKIKSCITSQVIFYIQVYLDLVHQKLEENKSKTMNEFLSDFKIGIIGCGVIGKSVLNALVFLLGWVEPNNIHISTRRPENLSKYEDIGFNIYFDNEKLIEQCDVVIICFPPSLDNWAIVELKESILQRQQNQNKMLQPFIISVVSNMYLNKLQKLLLIERIFARTHIAVKDQLDSELKFGMQLFQDKQLIQQILIAFQFIFQGTKIKEEEEFQLSDIQSNIQKAFLGNVFKSLDENDLANVAAAQYEQRSTIFKNILSDILKQYQS
ncbi:hypothetical protein ABPG72_006543 [Tetrahymena utriculariae]